MKIELDATDGAARAATISTGRGSFATPVFMPVGTRGAVRTLDTTDLDALGAPVILGNTYHLMLRPGAERVGELGGLHGFMGWDGHVLTDSGGFQIFSLEPKVDEDGAQFRSTYDGSRHHLSPERAVEIQALLGADIQMALDVCPALPGEPQTIRAATERTHRWADRARRAFENSAIRPAHQVQFGIVQGGVDPALRQESARYIAAVGFEGHAVGGLSVGEPRHEMVPALAAATAQLPTDRPRYLMGVGDPAGLVEGVANGIDLFDCVLPTRHARHGALYTDAGKINLRNARFSADDGPLDPSCPCPFTDRYSRAYLRHLLVVNELTALRLLSLHNLFWTIRLMRRMREAIEAHTFASLREEILEVWG